MAKTKRLPKLWITLPLLLILAVGAAFGARFIYNKLREPDFYKPSGEVEHVSPISRITNSLTPIKPKEPGTKALLPGGKWIAQSFNNCGPATTSMVLQYFGHSVNQNETKAKLRTNDDDKNVFTYEMANYMREEYGVESKLFYGGDIALLKKLIANGFYVVVEDWLHPNEDIGHVTIIRGFDDEQGVLIADDSFIGINITYPYEEFSETQWKAFNYEYLPVYEPGNEELLKAIVGSSWDEKAMFKKAAAMAEAEIAQNQNDMHAWFNLGTSKYGLQDYTGAQQAFDKSLALGWPKRMLWYQIQPIQTANALGDYQKALQLADLALWSNDSFAEAHLEKAIAYKGLGNKQKAREEVDRALFFAPNLQSAQDFLASL
ncbi:MAG: C39 family peptidase [Microgenomates group bacterium]